MSSLLPPNARLLVEIIGLDAALRLIKERGGETFVFAKGIRREGGAQYAEISEIVGEENAAKLGAQLGGTPYSIPLCAKAMRAARDDKIRAEFDILTREENYSGRAAIEHLTRAHRPITDRTIWRILGNPASVAGNDAQLGLF